MIKMKLIETLEDIKNILDDDNCPIIDPDKIEVCKISEVNDATANAYKQLEDLIDAVKYDV